MIEWQWPSWGLGNRLQPSPSTSGYLIKMRNLVIALAALAALGAAVWSSAQASGFKIIVHPDNPATSLVAKDVSNLLLKKKPRWDENGFREPATPIDLNGNSSTREEFSKAVHGRSVSKIKSYWQRQIFTGTAAPPHEAASDAEVIAFVSSNPGAIGYVSSGARLDGVKELALAN